MNDNDNGNSPDVDLDKQLTEAGFPDLNALAGQGNAVMTAGAKLGVLQKIVTSVPDDKEYRQSLLLSCFDNKQEALLASDAITERLRYGVSIEPILARLSAQCAVKAGRVEAAIRAMSHHSVSAYTDKRLKPDDIRKPIG